MLINFTVVDLPPFMAATVEELLDARHRISIRHPFLLANGQVSVTPASPPLAAFPSIKRKKGKTAAA